MRHRPTEIRGFILENVSKHPSDIATVASSKFGISRQAVNRHLRSLVSEQKLNATGSTRNRRYKLRLLQEFTVELAVNATLQEDLVWRENFATRFDSISENVTSICNYGLTEMLNNVIDHSSSSTVIIRFELTSVSIRILIIDFGVGIFKKICSELGLSDERHAILELAKGKLTTDPERHTGEGIFFSSRMFDRFAIVSGDLQFTHVGGQARDWLVDIDEELGGTNVLMEISTSSTRTLVGIFSEFSSDYESYGFTRTTIPVRLARYEGERLLSRSQAKRLLARVNRFEEVVLDFTDVESVGQAFADEIFRVFCNEHPKVSLIPLNTTVETQRMIDRVLNSREDVREGT